MKKHSSTPKVKLKKQKTPLPEKKALLEAYKSYLNGNVSMRVSALHKAAAWWDAAIPVLMKRKPLTPVQINDLSKANKAKALAVGGQTPEETETALRMYIRRCERIWDDDMKSSSIPSVDPWLEKFKTTKAGLEQKAKQLQEKHAAVTAVLNDAYKPLGFSFEVHKSEKDRMWNGDRTILLSSKLVRVLSEKLKREGVLPLLLGELFTLVKSSGIEKSADNSTHVPNLQTMLKNVPVALESALSYSSGLQRGKVFKAFGGTLEAKSTDMPEKIRIAVSRGPKAPRDPNAPKAPRVSKAGLDPSQLVGGIYPPGSTKAMLYQRLEDGKPHPLSEVFKDLPVSQPAERLKWVVKKGKATGRWTITINGNVAQMTVHKSAP